MTRNLVSQNSKARMWVKVRKRPLELMRIKAAHFQPEKRLVLALFAIEKLRLKSTFHLFSGVQSNYVSISLIAEAKLV